MEGTEYPVYVHSDHSKLHFAIEHDGNMLSNEKCNLDDIDAATRVVTLEPPEDWPEHRYCLLCFPGRRKADA